MNDLLNFCNIVVEFGFRFRKRFLNMIHKDLTRRKFGHILSHFDARFVELQQLNLFVAALCAEQQSDRCFLARLHFILF